MAELSVSKMAFAGFGLIRREPKAVAIWTGMLLVFFLGAIGTMLVLALPELAAAVRAAEGAETAAASARFFGKIGPLYLVFFVAALVAYAVFMAAVMRSQLRPAERGFAYLRLGGDELRLMGLILLFYILIAIGGVACVILFIIAGIAMVQSGNDAAQGGGGLVFALLMPALLWGFVYFGVRLSMAVPMTFAERRIRLFGSWAVTRGRFWPLFGGLFLAAVAGVMMVYAGELVAIILFMIGGGGVLAANSAAFSADPSAALASLGPVLMVIGAVVVTVIIALQVAAQVVMLAPYAAAYRMLTGDPEEAAETFA
jgi:hypothetical protein